MRAGVLRTIVLDARMILLDIEGTTTPITFVTQVLYPYPRTHLRSYLRRYGDSPQYLALIAAFRQEHQPDERAGEPVPPASPARADARPSTQASATCARDGAP